MAPHCRLRRRGGFRPPPRGGPVHIQHHHNLTRRLDFVCIFHPSPPMRCTYFYLDRAALSCARENVVARVGGFFFSEVYTSQSPHAMGLLRGVQSFVSVVSGVEPTETNGPVDRDDECTHDVDGIKKQNGAGGCCEVYIVLFGSPCTAARVAW